MGEKTDAIVFRDIITFTVLAVQVYRIHVAGLATFLLSPASKTALTEFMKKNQTPAENAGLNDL